MPEDLLSVDRVRAHVEPLGITVQELPADASTAQLAAEALQTTVATIVKSLLFVAGEEPVLVLAAGDRRVDARELAHALGVPKVRLAKPDEVIRIAGYAVGGVPPVAHRRPVRTLLDRHLLEHPTVFAAAGAANAIFPISPQQLLELTAAEVTDAVQ